MAQWYRTHLPIQETQVQSLGWKDTLEEGVETHSRILAWRIPCREEPGGLESRGRRVGHGFATEHTHTSQHPVNPTVFKGRNTFDSLALLNHPVGKLCLV